MDWMEFLQEAIPCLGAGIGFLYGGVKAFRRGVALYLKLVVLALGSLFLGKLYGVVSLLTAGALPEGFHVGYLGIFGCFLFLFSANYGQMDGLIDDKDKAMQKYRWMGYAAPMVLSAGTFPMMFAPASMEVKVVIGLVMRPAALGAYYNLKHLIFPDLGFGFVRAIRPCNLCALILYVLCLMEMVCGAWQLPGAELAAAIALSGVCVAMSVLAERGTKLWTT